MSEVERGGTLDDLVYRAYFAAWLGGSVWTWVAGARASTSRSSMIVGSSHLRVGWIVGPAFPLALRPRRPLLGGDHAEVLGLANDQWETFLPAGLSPVAIGIVPPIGTQNGLFYRADTTGAVSICKNHARTHAPHR